MQRFDFAVIPGRSIGASANLYSEKKFPSSSEPVRGPAPDIVGREIANRLGQFWSGALMLERLCGRASTRPVTGATARQDHRLTR